MPGNHQALFDEQELRASPWEMFAGRAQRMVVSPAAVCRILYEEWKKLYRQFRDLEGKALYGPDRKGALPSPDEGVLRGHRHSIAILVQRGEELAQLVDQIAGSLPAEERSAVHDLKIPLGVLLESLRESMELWHPANKPKGGEELRGLFTED